MMAIFKGTDFDDDIDSFFYSSLIPGYYGGGSDAVYGYDGDDLIYGYGGHDDLYGGYDHDTIYGGTGNDFMRGDAGNDDLFGESGHDDLYGGTGLDSLSGGSGDDLLVGGAGRDTLAGGAGEDVFAFKRGESGLSTSTVDTIKDWNRNDDWIDMTVKGTSINYREHSTTATSIASALIWAEDLYPSVSVKHVFLYNTKTDTGYLVSDLNSDGVFDTGVVLKNAGLASDMSYAYII
jgi:Ca2+-binding RTX toxin-like protein